MLTPYLDEVAPLDDRRVVIIAPRDRAAK